jgi:hypothetical protein
MARRVFRGGWGLYYGRVINSTVYNTLVNTGVGIDRGQRQFTTSATNLPTACTGTNPPTNADNCAFLPIYPNLLPSSNPPVGAVQFFSDDFQLPQIHQWDFIVEREIARNTVVRPRISAASAIRCRTSSIPTSPAGVAIRIAQRLGAAVWRFKLLTLRSSSVRVLNPGRSFSLRRSRSRRFLEVTRTGAPGQSTFDVRPGSSNPTTRCPRASDNGQTSQTFTSQQRAVQTPSIKPVRTLCPASNRRQKVCGQHLCTRPRIRSGRSGQATSFNGWTARSDF